MAEASIHSITADWLRRLESAANAQDSAALQAQSAPSAKNDFSWAAQSAAMITVKQPWRAGSLNFGDDDYVTFSRFHPCESAGDHLYHVVSTPQGPQLGPEVPETDTLGTRVRHHRLAVRLDVPHRQAYITDVFEVLANWPVAVVRLNSNYTVTSVRNILRQSVQFKQSGGYVCIYYARGRGEAGTPLFEMSYHGMADMSAEDYIRPNSAALCSYWYPHTGRLPADSEESITVPRGWSAVGQGEFVGKTVTANAVTYSWRNRLPVSYITVAAGRYTVTTHKLGGIAVSAYLLKPNRARADQAISVAAGAISWFSRHFSKFPYSRYAVVEAAGLPAALECYSFTLCGSSLIPTAEVHEISHTWWGGIVPNTYTRSMWNESFAEYSDGLYCRQTGAFGMHEFTAKLVGMATGLSGSSLLEAKDALDLSQSIAGYGKGSLMLENLERMLGTPRMLDCMQRFIVDHQKTRSGEDAEWQDFVNAVAETAGDSWRGYFEAWLHERGLPRPRLHDVHARRAADGYEITGRITQSPTPFWLHLPLVVQTDRGTDQPHGLDVKEADQPFRFIVHQKPTRLSMDPSNQALRALPDNGPEPNLLALQTYSGPLLVVYATGGSADENAADSAAAAGPLSTTFPFARIRVTADVAATRELLESGSVLLIGRTESLRIPLEWKSWSPLRCTDRSIEMDGRTWRGDDLWGLAVQSHPTKAKALIAQAAGTGAGAISNFTRQADLDTLKSMFVVRGAGKQVAADTGKDQDSDTISLKVEN